MHLLTINYRNNCIVDRCLQDVAMEFGVQAMPSFVFVRKGEVIDRVVGARKEELQKKIEKHRN